MSSEHTELEPKASGLIESGFKNDPNVLIETHLSRLGAPSAQSINAAAEIISTSYGQSAALGVCIDLNRVVSQPTTVIAGMFTETPEALPTHWRANPEITRTVLSMCGQIEIGILRAQQIEHARWGGNPRIDERLGEVSQFVEALQQK